MAISEKLIVMAQEIAKDEIKMAKGNFSAGTRIRKALVGIKNFCDTERKAIQETRNAAE